jgi:hypothetical protein
MITSLRATKFDRTLELPQIPLGTNGAQQPRPSDKSSRKCPLNGSTSAAITAMAATTSGAIPRLPARQAQHFCTSSSISFKSVAGYNNIITSLIKFDS